MKENAQRIVSVLLRNILQKQTATTLAEKLKMSRWGIWKILKELEKEGMVILTSVGSGKTSTHLVGLNWKNELLEKTLTLILAQEASQHERWKFVFSELRDYADFFILYGSVLHSPKEARDIDILGVVSDKNNFNKIDKIILAIQKTRSKSVHSINFTPEEFKKELENDNKAFLDAVKKGVVLFGQEKFVKFIKELANGI